MPPSDSGKIATQILVLWLSTVVLISLMAGFVAILLATRRRRSGSGDRARGQAAHACSFASFGSPCRWLAVRSANLAAVQEALGLRHARPCGWDDGLAGRNDHPLFIAPPVRGWTLVFGQALPDPGEDVDECFRFIRRLGRVMGEVQFFSANRAVAHHAWVLADGDRILRAYAWAGGTVWNQGPLTSAEKVLGLTCLAYGVRPDPPSVLAPESARENTEKVPALAARWSLDPSTLNEDAFGGVPGVAGELVHSKQH